MHDREQGDDLRALRQGVEQRLGLCLLRLQHYERMLKALLARQELSFSVDTFEKAKAERIALFERQTLGTLVNQFLGSYLTTDASPSQFADEDDAICTVTFRFTNILADETYTQLSNNLREFVTLRNTLVHSFIDANDLESVEGCKAAQAALDADLARIKLHYTDLRAWAEQMIATGAQMSEVMRDPAFYDWMVTGKIPWPQTQIVAALRDALTELAVDGWMPVTDAARWMTQHHPDETPAQYGCRGWPHLLHQTGLFQIEYRDVDGRNVRGFRERGQGKPVI